METAFHVSSCHENCKSFIWLDAFRKNEYKFVHFCGDTLWYQMLSPRDFDYSGIVLNQSFITYFHVHRIRRHRKYFPSVPANKQTCLGQGNCYAKANHSFPSGNESRIRVECDVGGLNVDSTETQPKFNVHCLLG